MQNSLVRYGDDVFTGVSSARALRGLDCHMLRTLVLLMDGMEHTFFRVYITLDGL